MRVALIDPSLFTLPYDRHLALGLQQGGHDVVLYGRRLGPLDVSAEGITLAPHFYPLTGAAPLPWLPRAPRLALKGAEHLACMAALPARLRRARPDIIHFQWLPLPVVDHRFLPALRRIAPLVLTAHDSTPFNGSPSARLQSMDLHRSHAAFDRLIVHTEQFRARLVAEGVPEGRVARVPHGLLGGAEPAPAEPDAADRPTTFLLFGQIKPYKGLDLLIEAFARLPPALQATSRLHVLGRPFMDLAPALELARARGVAQRLTLEPRFVTDDEIPTLYGPGSVAVMPYRQIESSGVLTLAVAHGRPIIASRIGAFAEDLTDGVHGTLVPPDDADALAAAMRRMIVDRGFMARCASNVRALAGATPSWEDIGRRTAALYADAIAERKRGGGAAPALSARPDHADAGTIAAHTLPTSEGRG